ncbi:hypothetical protein [Pseudomonas entomophila]|uniref:Uncharacterized protein n=2 Tax=Pseudomonas entomophila TaxID=312306 RepID=Q1ICJ6_PSEE4|nr:hypothetical protein [Pseudomonas entomophila]WMW04581.1 hypothetical protein RAH46_19870 [Pseudomonas entomophila]CAK14617.1 hypothetical protein PSEEN1774 [Pseudomonas entomophila L48]
MGDTDTLDFNKARSYLIGFSTLVLLLWYFGADLSTFKLLGNEIKLKENVQNVWMVLAGINVYLWLRLYQRSPEGSFQFDLAMHELYEKTLIAVMKRLKKKEMREHALKLIEETPGNAQEKIKLLSFTPKGRMTYVERPTPPSREKPDRLTMIRKLESDVRNEINYGFYIHYTVDNNDHHQQGGQGFITTPSSLVAKLVQWYVFARGAVVSPWFFDQITPFALGGMSIGVAIFKWYQINFPHL